MNSLDTLLLASTASAGSVTIIVFLILALIAVLLVGVWLTVRAIAHKKHEYETVIGIPVTTCLIFVVVLGTLVRSIFAILVKGDMVLFGTLVDSSKYINGSGLAGYYDNGVRLYPLMAYYVALFGKVGEASGYDSSALQFVLKLPFIIADIVMCIVLYRIGKKFANARLGLVIASLYALNPLFIFNSSMAGNPSSIATLFVVLSLYFILNKNYLGFVGFYIAALLTDRSAQLLIAPMLVYCVYLIVRAINKIRLDGTSGMTRDSDRSAVILVPLAILVGLALSFVIGLPFVIKSSNSGVMHYFNTLWLDNLTNLEYFGSNSLAIFNIFLRNGVPLGTAFPAMVFSILFFVLVAGITVVLYLIRKNRANFVLIVAFVIATIAIYFVDMTAYSLVPVCALLLLIFVLIRDKRIIKLFAIFCMLVGINGLAGFLNSGSMSNIYTSGSNMVLLDSGFWLAVNIICTLITVIVHIYFALVVIDICMTNRIIQFDAQTDASFGSSLRQILK